MIIKGLNTEQKHLWDKTLYNDNVMVQEAKKKTVHMEGTWRLESTSAGLHPYEAVIQKQCEGCADTAWGRY